MLLNTTHNDKKIITQINDLVGKPYGLLDNFKLKGIGSPRLDIVKASNEIEKLLNRDNHRNYGNIELRPNGILFRFHTRLETYALVIPYYKLVIFKPGNSYTLHIDQHFVSFEALPTHKSIHRFVEKIMDFQLKSKPDNFVEIP